MLRFPPPICIVCRRQNIGDHASISVYAVHTCSMFCIEGVVWVGQGIRVHGSVRAGLVYVLLHRLLSSERRAITLLAALRLRRATPQTWSGADREKCPQQSGESPANMTHPLLSQQLSPYRLKHAGAPEPATKRQTIEPRTACMLCLVRLRFQSSNCMPPIKCLCCLCK